MYLIRFRTNVGQVDRDLGRHPLVDRQRGLFRGAKHQRRGCTNPHVDGAGGQCGTAVCEVHREIEVTARRIKGGGERSRPCAVVAFSCVDHIRDLNLEQIIEGQRRVIDTVLDEGNRRRLPWNQCDGLGTGEAGSAFCANVGNRERA